MSWNYSVKVKYLFTRKEDHKSIQESMNAIADALEGDFAFLGFSFEQWRDIPKGDEFFGPVDYANKLLDRLYDYADINRIWIG